jgi:hypothetical protein
MQNDECLRSKVKIKSPEPVRVRDWVSFVQSQAVAGSDNAHVAAAARVATVCLRICFMAGIIQVALDFGEGGKSNCGSLFIMPTKRKFEMT